MAGEAQHFVDRPAALAGRDGVEVGYFTFSWTPLPIDTSGSLMKTLEPSVSEVDEPSTSGSGVVIAVQIWQENWTPHDRESSA
jgi:hypothetical protein